MLNLASARSLFVLAGLALAPALHASTFYVDAVGGDDVAGDGSLDSPWRTITRAHQETLAPGDVVSIAPGVYNGPLGEVFPIQLQPRVQVIGAGPNRTFVRGEGDGTLFRTGSGQVWFWLANLTLARGDVGVLHAPSSGSDTFLVLERLIVEGCATGVRGADTTGAYSQTALVNCALRNNGVAIRAEENWQGFGETWLYVYGTTITKNTEAIQGTSAFGVFTRFTLKHSIVQGNEDDFYLAGLATISPIEGSLTAEPSLDGVNGNADAPPGFLAPAVGDPHLRTDSLAVDRYAATSLWPPGPLPPSWWGDTPWAADFAAVPDLDGRVRTDLLVDAGCDEVETPSVHHWGQPTLGATVDLVATGSGGNTLGVFYAFGAGGSLATPFGVWELEFPWAVLLGLPLDAAGHAVITAPVPANPTLAGIDVWFQGITLLAPMAVTAVDRLRFLPG